MDRRRGGRWHGAPTLLPLRRTRPLHNTVSCCYCDFKLLALNEPLFRFGSRHSRYLRVWFSMGIGFSLSALFGAIVFILCELARAAPVYVGLGISQRDSSLHWLSFWNFGFNISLSSMGYLSISSILSIIVHEFGHALAAASEGVKMEYLAIFLAGLFPGALVAFNHASLLALPKIASLRIYCAGIWHNAIFCALCTLALCLLPFILSPFYVHGEAPMVLDVPSESPLSGYISPNDVISSLNDFRVHTEEEWKQMITKLAKQPHSLTASEISELPNLKKGYCIPYSTIEMSFHIQFEGNVTYCPGEFTAFTPVPCLEASKDYGTDESNNQQKAQELISCLDANEVIKLRKCAYNSEQAPQNQSSCICSQVESCMKPVQLPGQGWAEITYSSSECFKPHSSNGEENCHKTFVFVGDLISLSHSLHLTSYQPRWSIRFTARIPHLLEKLFTYAFHVSLLIALLNSLPVYFLDGESIVEAALDSYSSLSSRMKQLVLRCGLLAGTFLSTCYFLQMVYLSVS